VLRRFGVSRLAPRSSSSGAWSDGYRRYLGRLLGYWIFLVVLLDIQPLSSETGGSGA